MSSDPNSGGTSISRALGQGSEYSPPGQPEKVFRLAPWEFAIQGAFERYLERYAFDKLRHLSRYLSAEEAAEARSALVEAFALELYRFGGEKVRKALESRIHATYLVWLQLKRHQPDVELKAVEEMLQADWDGLVDAASRANAVPNAGAPADTGVGPAGAAAAATGGTSA